MYADEDSLPSEKEEELQVNLMNSKNILRQSENKTVIYVRQEGVEEKSPNTQENGEDGGMVVIKITPDDQGRFGFNVKGGADLHLPVNFHRSHQSLFNITTSDVMQNFFRFWCREWLQILRQIAAIPSSARVIR